MMNTVRFGAAMPSTVRPSVQFQGKYITDKELKQRLQDKLGMSPSEVKQLVDLSKVKNRFPVYAGKLSNDQVYLVTQQDTSAPGEKFTGYENYFKVYVGYPGDVQELNVTSAGRMRDGGTTDIRTSEGVNLHFPTTFKNEKATIDGCRTVVELPLF